MIGAPIAQARILSIWKIEIEILHRQRNYMYISVFTLWLWFFFLSQDEIGAKETC